MGGVHEPATFFGFLCLYVCVCVLYIPALTVVQREPPIVCVNTAGGASVKSLKGGKQKKKKKSLNPSEMQHKHPVVLLL